MALKIDYPLNGVVLEYHRIIDLIQDYRNGIYQVIVGSYVSKPQRELDTNSILATRQFNVLGADMTRADIYAYLKISADFAGALDI